MAPMTSMDFVILKMIYVPYADTSFVRITMTRRTHSLSGSMSQERHWFNRKISQELSKLSSYVGIYFVEWEVVTADPTLFIFNKTRFDKAYVLFGEEDVHWVFYRGYEPYKRREGSDRITFCFCGCCMHMQYLDVMDFVRESAIKLRTSLKKK